MHDDSASPRLVIVGAGPAGLAPLFAAASIGRLQEVLRLGVTILERGDRVGCGGLSGYAIRSDSGAETFLDIVSRTAEPRLGALRAHPAARALEKLGKGAAPLSLVAEFLTVAGETLCDIVAGSKRGHVLLGTEVVSLTQTVRGTWRTRYRRTGTGGEGEIASECVLLATGAHQPEERLWEESVGGVALLPRYQGKILQSGEVLRNGGAAAVARRLRTVTAPRIVVVGGSTSAGAVATSLLGPEAGLPLEPGALTLMHRQPLRIFYESVAEAVADGYDEFLARDVCSLSGRVYRFSGFRLDSRELIMRARGIGGRVADPRLRLFSLAEQTSESVQDMLEQADLIVPAFGYRPRIPPVFDSGLQPLPVASLRGRGWSIVDRNCRLLQAGGTPMKNLFAMGLAVGPAPSTDLGGERDFAGQINSLWMWQHTLGLRMVEALPTGGSEQRAQKMPGKSRGVPSLHTTAGARSGTFFPAYAGGGK